MTKKYETKTLRNISIKIIHRWLYLSNKHIQNDKLIAFEQEYKMPTGIGYSNIYWYFVIGTKKQNLKKQQTW